MKGHIRSGWQWLWLMFVAVVPHLHSQIILEVNISNPSAVTFTATGNSAAASVTTGATTFPIWLNSFFTVDNGQQTFTATSSTLTTQAGNTLGSALTRAIPAYTTLVLRYNASSSETFSTSAAGFLGSATFDLSAFSSSIRQSGSGNIYAYNGSTTTLVGTYTVSAVPEPATWASAAGIICIGFVFFRKRQAPSKV